MRNTGVIRKNQSPTIRRGQLNGDETHFGRGRNVSAGETNKKTVKFWVGSKPPVRGGNRSGASQITKQKIEETVAWGRQVSSPMRRQWMRTTY